MLTHIATLISKNIKNENSEYGEIIEYGLIHLIMYSTFIFLCVIGMLILNCYIEVIIFIFSFMLLRNSIGGFHFNKSYICMTASLLISLIIPWFIKYQAINFSIGLLIVQVILSVTIFILSPLDNVNKIITPEEKKKFKNKALKILLIYNLISFSCFFLFLNNSLNLLLFYSLITNLISLVIGKFRCLKLFNL